MSMRACPFECCSGRPDRRGCPFEGETAQPVPIHRSTEPRVSLDRHATYVVAAFLAGAAGRYSMQ
jgi:hypothetical protein